MKKVLTLKSILIFVFLLLPVQVHAVTDYYVTQDGDGDRSGDASNPFSVLNYNALTGSYQGDTFFFLGNFSSEIRPQTNGADGNHVILDGYETDDTKYMNLSEVTGRAKISVSGADGIDIDGVSYITIQDFEITDGGSQAIRIQGAAYDVVIRRNYIYEQEGGIISYENSYNITIGGESGHGNVLKNIGIDTGDEDIALQDTHDVIISYNHLYATDGSGWGIDGVLGNGGTDDILIEYNSIHDHNRPSGGGGDHGEDGIDFKKDDASDTIIRFNNIYNHFFQTCVTVQSGAYNFYVYGNRCNGNERGVATGDSPSNDDVYIFSNIISDEHRYGINIGFQGTVTDATVFNNTLVGNGTCTELNDVGICDSFTTNNKWGNAEFTGSSSTAIFKNNIVYKGRPNDNNYQQSYISTSMDTVVDSDYNIYYWPSQTSKIFWGDSGLLTLAQVQVGSIDGLPEEQNSTDENPGLVNIDNDDYRIASETSGAYGAGVDMGSDNIVTLTIQGDPYPVWWDFALGPNTDWSGTIPVIEVLRRDVIGWDIGAYGYDGISFGGVTIN